MIYSFDSSNSYNSFKIDKSWTLFLDRDGVINQKRDNDYVKNYSEFNFLDGVLDAISFLSKVFGKTIIITNQRGVGRGVISESDLRLIHSKMKVEINIHNGRIDKIYFCTGVLDSDFNRKPNIGMGLQAKMDFPSIDFNKSVMIGDSYSDMLFGNKLGMKCVLIKPIKETDFNCKQIIFSDSLSCFAKSVKELI